MRLIPLSQRAERFARKHGNNFQVRFGPSIVLPFNGHNPVKGEKSILCESTESPTDAFWLPVGGNQDWRIEPQRGSHGR